MRVLLTRASGDAARTKRTLEAAGHSVVLAPMIDVVPAVVHWPADAVDALVATSAHAFAATVEGAPWDLRRRLPLLIVGARTEAAAREAAFSGPVILGGSAADLVARLDARQAWPVHAVYLAAADRKPDVEQAFAARGAVLELRIAYRAQARTELPVDAGTALRDGRIDAILHYSRRTAGLFVDACEKAGIGVSRPVHFCLSVDVAAGLAARGVTAAKIAASPTEADLLALLSD